MEKYVRIGFMVVGLLVWALLAPAFAALFQLVNPNLDRMLIGAQFTVSDVLAIVCGVATATILWFNDTVNQLGLEVGNELRNVTWPTWPETRVSTVVVIVTTVVVSLILALMDAVWAALSQAIYRL